MSEILCLYLGWYGCHIRNATNGEEAVKILSAEEVHLILLDLVLPRMDGFEVLRVLKEKIQKRPYIIVISAMGSDESKKKALALGANEYLVKPFNLSTLLERIQALHSNIR
ncbi:MAG: response regulator [Deltaproteobacteria bacterium]|nr:response regulator [Deltaproteobacteria bacterium]